MLAFSSTVKADVYTIGTDTIHFFNGNYYYIGNNDTVLADTSVITIGFESPSQSVRNQIATTYGLTLSNAFPNGYCQYKTNIGYNYIDQCNALLNDPNITEISLHTYMTLFGFEPNDYDITEQWYLSKIGVYDEETNTGVWDITTGNEDITIAVIDGGLDWDSEEFGPAITNIDVVYHNPGEDEWTYWDHPASGNNLDDDANGFFNDLKGWDFYQINILPGGSHEEVTDNDVRSNYSDNWHGNAVAGIIGAKTNNGESVAGIAGGDAENGKNGVKILPLKIMDYWYYPDGSYTPCIPTERAEQAIYYAVDQGAKVINMSWGISYSITNLNAALNYAQNNGVTLVGASGNFRYNGDIAYPADNPNVIAVGSTNEYDEFCGSFSSYGSEQEIVAPGLDIPVLTTSAGYSEIDFGTSYSAAMVSATVGLMLSVNPYLSNGDISEDGSIRNILSRTNDKVGSGYVNGWDDKYGYGRLNTYAAVCMAIDYLPNLVVENSGTWSERVISQKDIIIKEGVELTITGEVLMGKDAKIVVEPGAILTVDGGTITNMPFCGKEDQRWAGIEVWGNSNDNQFEYTGHPLNQGKLVLESATIENAVVAVRLFNHAEISSTTGGVLLAENSIFYNNIRALSVFPFKNIVNPIVDAVEHDYVCILKNCVFQVDENYIGANTFSSEHVMLWGVKGIRFYGCVFENRLDDAPTSRAIYTFDAGYSIKGYCNDQTIQPCPTGEYQRSVFHGFYRAIESTNVQNALYGISVYETDFDYNGYGLYFNAVRNAIVMGNNFELGFHNDCTETGSTGIYLDNCKSFAIEKNTFSVHSNPVYALHNIGIHTKNTNNPSDEIYNNQYSNMEVANYAEGKNWGIDNSSGLAYYCNENQYNYFDFYVKEGDPQDGIQKYQGYFNHPAGNTFSPFATGQFHNFGSYELDYFYDQNSALQTPDDQKLYRVKKTPVSISSVCPDHYSGTSVKLTAAEYQQYTADFSTYFSLYSSTLHIYDSIGQSGDSTTRRLLEEQMSYYNRLYSKTVYDIIRSDLSDTITHPDNFVNWKETLSRYADVESLIDYYLQTGNTTTAMNKVDSLPYLFSFTSYDSLEYPYYQQLKATQANLIASQRTIFELTDTEIEKLKEIADNSIGIAGAQARGIMGFAVDNSLVYAHCVELTESTIKNAPITNENTDNNNGQLVIGVSPNPAKDFVTFTYALPEKASTGEVIIYNQEAVVMDKIILNNAKGEMKFNTSNLLPGLYFYSVSSQGEVVTGKIVILR
jgi:subtilisin family serine protease